MEISTGLVVTLIVLFTVIGIGASVIYYFARYYVKTDETDKELFTKKPVQLTKKTLTEVLSKSHDALWGRISKVAFQTQMSSQVRDQVEEVLYSSDLGPKTSEELLVKVTENLSQDNLRNIDSVRAALRTQISDIFGAQKIDGSLFDKVTSQKPLVWMVVGVNGVGKTTTIGKLASLAKIKNLKTMIVAGDTFRAAADSQLKAWAERAGCEIFSPDNVKDPSAVAYAGLEKAKAQNLDLVIVDTAGRLHTQSHLMEELKKMKRSLDKIMPGAPHELLLVIDANAGQNALQQAREFNSAVQLTGAIITKLDGSSKAGVAIGIVNEVKIPISYIGVGEAIEDLRPFDAKAFVEAII